MPQESFLFSATIADNIALARADATRDDVERAARMADLGADIRRFPDGYETPVGERGVTLSGGQRQRVAIARALLTDAPLLLLDDALSAVDTATEARILAHLRDARAGRTAIIVSHRLSAVADADLILVLKAGRVVERGTHARTRSRATAGTRRSGATSSSKRASRKPYERPGRGRRRGSRRTAPHAPRRCARPAAGVRAAVARRASRQTQVVWATLWLAVAGLLEAAGPIFGKRFIDEYLLPRHADVATMARWSSAISSPAGSRRSSATSSSCASRASRRARCGACASACTTHVLAAADGLFDHAITGQLVSRITNDTEAVKQLYTQVLFELLLGLTVLFGVVVAMLWLDWRLMLIVLLLVPATIGIVLGYQRLSAARRRRARASSAATSTRRWPRASPA